MNDAKLTKLLAEAVMGWETMDDWSENEFVSNDSGAIFVDETNNIAHLDWNPFTSWDDCMMVVEKLRDLNWDISIQLSSRIQNDCGCEIFDDKLQRYWLQNKDAKIAICMSAITAARARGLIK